MSTLEQELAFLCEEADIGLGKKSKLKILVFNEDIKTFKDLVDQNWILDPDKGSEKELLKVILWAKDFKENNGRDPVMTEGGDFSEDSFQAFKKKTKNLGQGYVGAASDDEKDEDEVYLSTQEEEEEATPEMAKRKAAALHNLHNTDVWYTQYAKLQQFHKLHSHCNVPMNYTEDATLPIWVRMQRQRYHKEVNFNIICNNQGLLHQDNELANRHSKTKQDTQTNSNMASNGDKRSLTQDRIDHLNALHFVWGVGEDMDWDDKYSRLVAGEKDDELTKWVAQQRAHKAQLSAEAIACLESIDGFEWAEGAQDVAQIAVNEKDTKGDSPPTAAEGEAETTTKEGAEATSTKERKLGQASCTEGEENEKDMKGGSPLTAAEGEAETTTKGGEEATSTTERKLGQAIAVAREAVANSAPAPGPDQAPGLTAGTEGEGKTSQSSIGQHDVLLGKGRGKSHGGNIRFREIVANKRQFYIDAKGSAKKKAIAQECVNEVKQNGGRFLEKDAISGIWVEVDNDQASKKASNALRTAKCAEGKDAATEESKVGQVRTEGEGKKVSSTAQNNGEHDVLLGRGGAVNSNKGNIHFREIIAGKQIAYLKAKKLEKKAIAQECVHAVKQNGGRFLKQDDTSGICVEVDNDQAIKKALQALREGLAEMRSQATDLAEKIGEHDVLLGRGAALKDNKGNIRFREIIASKRLVYPKAKKSEKKAIAQECVDQVKQNGGRFLIQDSASGSWVKADDGLANKRTLQALFEGLVRKRPQDTEEAVKIGEHDVLLGHGEEVKYNKGNIRFQDIVASKGLLYQDAKKKLEKKAVAQECVDEVKQDGGRFLKQDGALGIWVEVDMKVDNDQSDSKTLQELFEGLVSKRLRDGKSENLAEAPKKKRKKSAGSGKDTAGPVAILPKNDESDKKAPKKKRKKAAGSDKDTAGPVAILPKNDESDKKDTSAFAAAQASGAAPDQAHQEQDADMARVRLEQAAQVVWQQAQAQKMNVNQIAQQRQAQMHSQAPMNIQQAQVQMWQQAQAQRMMRLNMMQIAQQRQAQMHACMNMLRAEDQMLQQAQAQAKAKGNPTPPNNQGQNQAQQMPNAEQARRTQMWQQAAQARAQAQAQLMPNTNPFSPIIQARAQEAHRLQMWQQAAQAQAQAQLLANANPGTPPIIPGQPPKNATVPPQAAVNKEPPTANTNQNKAMTVPPPKHESFLAQQSKNEAAKEEDDPQREDVEQSTSKKDQSKGNDEHNDINPVKPKRKTAYQNILGAMAKFHKLGHTTVEKKKLASATKLTPGTLNDSIRKLKKNDVLQSGPEKNTFALTEKGRNETRGVEIDVGSPNKEIHEDIKKGLKPRAVQLFELIADGREHDKDKVAQDLGFTKDLGYKTKGKKQSEFMNVIASMKKEGIVHYPTKDTVQLVKEECFPYDECDVKNCDEGSSGNHGVPRQTKNEGNGSDNTEKTSHQPEQGGAGAIEEAESTMAPKTVYEGDESEDDDVPISSLKQRKRSPKPKETIVEASDDKGSMSSGSSLSSAKKRKLTPKPWLGRKRSPKPKETIVEASDDKGSMSSGSSLSTAKKRKLTPKPKKTEPTKKKRVPEKKKSAPADKLGASKKGSNNESPLQQLILDNANALAVHIGFGSDVNKADRKKVFAMCGVLDETNSCKNALKQLCKKEHIGFDANSIWLTDTGRGLAKEVDVTKKSAELLEMAKQRVSSKGKKLLDILADGAVHSQEEVAKKLKSDPAKPSWNSFLSVIEKEECLEYMEAAKEEEEVNDCTMPEEFVWVKAKDSAGENPAFLLGEDDEHYHIKWAANKQEEWLYKDENIIIKDSDRAGGRRGRAAAAAKAPVKKKKAGHDPNKPGGIRLPDWVFPFGRPSGGRRKQPAKRKRRSKRIG